MSVSLIHLWMPILGGAIFAWLASALIHMLFKYHNSDYRKLENEDDIMATVGQSAPSPGLYHFPHCADMSEMANEHMQKKMIKGPVGILSIFPNGIHLCGWVHPRSCR